MIHIRRDRLVRHRPDRLDHHLVRIAAQFDLENLELRSFLGFLTDDVFLIDADGKRGRGSQLPVETPDVIPGLVHDLSYHVVERNIDRGLGCRIPGGEAVDIFHDRLEIKRALEFSEVHF